MGAYVYFSGVVDVEGGDGEDGLCGCASGEEGRMRGEMMCTPLNDIGVTLLSGVNEAGRHSPVLRFCQPRSRLSLSKYS